MRFGGVLGGVLRSAGGGIVSTAIVQGAISPGETLEHRFSAPAGLDLTTTVTRVVSMSMRSRYGTVTALPGWVVQSVTASLLIATLEMDGDEFTETGDHTFIPSLILDGVEYRYSTVTRRVVGR